MCYLIETTSHLDLNDAITLTVEKISEQEMKEINVWLTSKHHYLGLTYRPWNSFSPFQTTASFGGIQSPKIIAKETKIQRLNCKKTNPNYVSLQQCIVDQFLSHDFSPCPKKCIPIQMKGFEYISNKTKIGTFHK